jgi:hypothetical protein
MLLRQIHHSQIQGDGIASSAFRPSKQHDGLLSTYDGEKFTAESAHEHYTNAGLDSNGVLGITREECQNIELSTIDDNYGFDGHVSIDFRNISKGQIEKKSKTLRDHAIERGWLYQKTG